MNTPSFDYFIEHVASGNFLMWSNNEETKWTPYIEEAYNLKNVMFGRDVMEAIREANPEPDNELNLIIKLTE